MCSICMEDVKEKTQPASCQHTFCFECINEWTTYTNACPLCKVTITLLHRYDSKGDLEQSIPVKPVVKQDSLEIADVCYVCRSHRSFPPGGETGNSST